MVKSKEKIIGRVIASENKPTTSTNLQFWATDETILRPFDIIKVDHISKNDDIKSKTYVIYCNDN